MTDPTYPGVYAIINTLNGNRYIGSAACLAVRWKYHRWELRRGRHHSQHLQRAWRKYGAAAFTFSVVERIDNPTQLVQREQHYLDTLQPEYNECRVAGSALGRPQTERQRAATAESNRRRVFTPELLTRMSHITRAQWQDPAAREKLSRRISEGQRASPRHAEARRAIGAKLRGRSLNISDEERERRRQSTKGLAALRWAKVRAAQSSVQLSIWE